MVILENGDGSYGAHVPDLPGCAAVAETETEALQLIKEAIELHLEGMRAEAYPFPSLCRPASTSRCVQHSGGAPIRRGFS